MNDSTLHSLIAAATPFLRIDGASSMPWCRNVQKGARFGPWKYEALFSVLDERTWARAGEVLYFVTDAAGQLRLVGESSRRLKDRWRVSPMHDISSQAPIGRKALFHSTAWGAIERGLGQEKAPFTVKAIFAEDVGRVVPDNERPALGALRDHLCRRVEASILREHGTRLQLWNSPTTFS